MHLYQQQLVQKCRDCRKPLFLRLGISDCEMQTRLSTLRVYISPDANASTALGKLHRVVSSQQSSHRDAVHIIAGGCNHAELKSVLHMFNQHVKCATVGVNTLDKIYSNIQKGYRARPLQHLGLSDHMSMLLIPTYTPLRRRAPLTTKTVTT